MERILTNLQVEWLTNIKLLAEYEDEHFSKKDMSEKFASFVENEYPGEENSIVYELQVLQEKGLVIVDEKLYETHVLVNDINITKRGLDYLTMLKEDFAEKMASNEKMLTMITEISKKNGGSPNKDILDHIEQISTILSNVVGLIPSVGNFCQGAIPFVKGLVKFKLAKKTD